MNSQKENCESKMGFQNSKKVSKKDFWNELTEIEKSEIKMGISQIENGLKVSFEDFLKKVN
ncbi:hypothetical protein [Lacihabitans soyangensis]|uniref:Uncharacterized protein n=1 Tax=Lacihabitans soyangensis TaxID=869394 RepID=A0AAE3KQX5_9BACT|nr:hypothetical protein [Lacihabitans soyangensis]MCP9761632.1 hypothetical protein [Lacihabitans soyangensis]